MSVRNLHPSSVQQGEQPKSKHDFVNGQLGDGHAAVIDGQDSICAYVLQLLYVVELLSLCVKWKLWNTEARSTFTDSVHPLNYFYIQYRYFKIDGTRRYLRDAVRHQNKQCPTVRTLLPF